MKLCWDAGIISLLKNDFKIGQYDLVLVKGFIILLEAREYTFFRSCD